MTTDHHNRSPQIVRSPIKRLIGTSLKNEENERNFAPLTLVFRCSEEEGFTIYPWVHQWCNNKQSADQIQPVRFPNVSPSLPDDANFSMAAGDFLEVYTEPGNWLKATLFFFWGGGGGGQIGLVLAGGLGITGNRLSATLFFLGGGGGGK